MDNTPQMPASQLEIIKQRIKNDIETKRKQIYAHEQQIIGLELALSAVENKPVSR